MPPDPLALIRRAKAERSGAAAGSAPPEEQLQALSLTRLPKVPLPIASLPPTVRYIPDFIDEADEAALLQHVLRAPASRWNAGSDGRRTQNWGGRPGERQVAEALPSWLAALVDALVASEAWPQDDCGVPNHVIINDYDAAAGLTPHSDGPLYAARVATLSLWSDVVMELHRPEEAAVRCEPPTRLARLLLRRRSLIVLSGDAYRAFHGIRRTEADLLDPDVINLTEAGGAEGEEVRRARRVSIVFVSKR